MKKYSTSLMLVLALVLSACGEDVDNNAVKNNPAEEVVDESEEVEETEGETSTEDLMEFARNDQYDTFIRYLEEYKEQGTYVHEDSDESRFNQIEFDGFHVDFIFKFLEDQRNGDQLLAFIAETENDSGDIVAYNADMTVVTSNGEEAEGLQGLGQSEDGESIRGLIPIPIEEGAPDSFVVTLVRPFRDVVNGEEVGHLGEDIEMEFHLE